ncbi:hypothetical protein N9N34_02640 [Candidatus Pelagibacter bacterium]|nr:hypothetical protein [Candidatus Pelagibacter bacterium]
MIYKSYLIEKDITTLKSKIVLFYGENLGLKNDFKKKIKLNNQEAEIINYIQDDVVKNEDYFFNEILNMSLFEKNKIYFIDQANDKILSLIQKIENKIDNQKLFILSPVLDKRSKLRNYFETSHNCDVVACYPDNELTIKNIVLDQLKGFKGLSTQNLNLIIDNSNLNRDRLNNELNKIISYFSEKEITADKLEKILDININEDFNLLKDEAFNGNKIKTNKLLSETVIDEEKNILYLSIINQRLNKLAETNELIGGTNLENAISLLKPPIFWKEKPMFLMQAKKWDSSKISNVLAKTYNLEIEIKSNATVNKNILMKKLLIDICTIANS